MTGGRPILPSSRFSAEARADSNGLRTMCSRTLLAVLALLVIFVGCGSAETTTSVKTVTTKTATITQSSLTRAQRFRVCLAQSGIRLRHISNVPGRVPLIQVPAAYLGAMANTNQVYDYWVAASPSDAQRAADELNAALSQKLGRRAKAAFANGFVVFSGNEGNEPPSTEEDEQKVRAADGCSAYVSQ
jgi:hypothetical protein